MLFRSLPAWILECARARRWAPQAVRALSLLHLAKNLPIQNTSIRTVLVRLKPGTATLATARSAPPTTKPARPNPQTTTFHFILTQLQTPSPHDLIPLVSPPFRGCTLFVRPSAKSAHGSRHQAIRPPAPRGGSRGASGSTALRNQAGSADSEREIWNTTQ